jgi:hypothetical protein
LAVAPALLSAFVSRSSTTKGRFLHHDGRNELDHHKLRASLPNADVVFCPVDCVSDDALTRIRLFCTQERKQNRLPAPLQSR